MPIHTFSADNNKVTVQGILYEDLEYDHTVLDENFYHSKIDILRSSGTHDIIPIIISERLADTDIFKKDVWVKIEGQFRSYNMKESEDAKPICKLDIFAQDIYLLNQSEQYYINDIFLDGYLCKDPKYRTTPHGREITDMVLAVNRAYRKSDYIPCICWGRNAKFADNFEVGKHICITGRIQSRDYIRRISETETESKTCYEVSINTISEISDEEYEEEVEEVAYEQV